MKFKKTTTANDYEDEDVASDASSEYMQIGESVQTIPTLNYPKKGSDTNPCPACYHPAKDSFQCDRCYLGVHPICGEWLGDFSHEKFYCTKCYPYMASEASGNTLKPYADAMTPKKMQASLLPAWKYGNLGELVTNQSFTKQLELANVPVHVMREQSGKASSSAKVSSNYDQLYSFNFKIMYILGTCSKVDAIMPEL